MSTGSQDIAGARAEREERERIEQQSEDDARCYLSVAGLSRDQNNGLIDVARVLGVASTESDRYVVTVWFQDGEYTVSVLRKTEG